MSEDKLKQDFDLSDIDLDEQNQITPYSETLPTKRDEKINLARRLYITTNQSLVEIALDLGLSKYTLQKISQKEKWTLLKQNPDFNTWSDEALSEVYTSMDFYDEVKIRLTEMLYAEQWQNPSDFKKIVESFRLADEKTTQLRSIVRIQDSDENV